VGAWGSAHRERVVGVFTQELLELLFDTALEQRLPLAGEARLEPPVLTAVHRGTLAFAGCRRPPVPAPCRCSVQSRRKPSTVAECRAPGASRRERAEGGRGRGGGTRVIAVAGDACVRAERESWGSCGFGPWINWTVAG
jgi:hypothetical protein